MRAQWYSHCCSRLKSAPAFPFQTSLLQFKISYHPRTHPFPYSSGLMSGDASSIWEPSEYWTLRRSVGAAHLLTGRDLSRKIGLLIGFLCWSLQNSFLICLVWNLYEDMVCSLFGSEAVRYGDEHLPSRSPFCGPLGKVDSANNVNSVEGTPREPSEIIAITSMSHDLTNLLKHCKWSCNIIFLFPCWRMFFSTMEP